MLLLGRHAGGKAVAAHTTAYHQCLSSVLQGGSLSSILPRLLLLSNVDNRPRACFLSHPFSIDGVLRSHRPVEPEVVHLDPSSFHAALASSFARHAVVTGMKMLTSHLGTSKFKPLEL